MDGGCQALLVVNRSFFNPFRNPGEHCPGMEKIETPRENAKVPGICDYVM